ncbi:exonuclease [Hamiltosporidium tvaerminnensis]|uniref:Exonuclease 1 n=2 Tax=Hamiltosporidium tvaerminnensis TaxID=1176355 RepID=A0A4Q9LTF5_9MICR|nr:exonuclease [Hamiltosporidium tvaerminnensis]
MGINGLLPLLKNHLQRKHISCFKNKRIGIDGHCWLYQIIPYIAEDLFYNVPNKRYVKAFLSKIKSILSHKIIPVVIFDGDHLPMKEHTLNIRQERKQKAKQEAMDALKRNDISRAKELMKQCVNVTREMVNDVIEELIKENIEFIISPYETDAQLTYLQNIGFVDCILTEDSDFIVYGCSSILYKFDGEFVSLYEREILKKVKDLFFYENIQKIAIMSGCDYIEGIKGLGVITAYKTLKKIGSEGLLSFLKQKNLDENFLKKMENAIKTFNHQVVFCPIQQKRINLNPLETNLYFLGDLIGNNVFSKNLNTFATKNLLKYKNTESKNETKRVLTDIMDTPESDDDLNDPKQDVKENSILRISLKNKKKETNFKKKKIVFEEKTSKYFKNLE